jgi:hypothetical protein
MWNRTITTETTDEQILAPIKTAKQALLDFVTAEVDGEYLKGDQMVALAQNVMTAEAVANVAMRYAQVVRAEATTLRKMEFLVGLLTRGADDTWSGRKNDSARSAHDAVRSFVEDQVDALKHDIP